MVNEAGECSAWFGLELDAETCKVFGSELKDTIIYELELLAGVFSRLQQACRCERFCSLCLNKGFC